MSRVQDLLALLSYNLFIVEVGGQEVFRSTVRENAVEEARKLRARGLDAYLV